MEAMMAIEATDAPVMNLINKRIRNLRKKYKRIIQIEEAVAQGKPINKEQEDVLQSKIGVCVLIEELEKLRNPLSVAVSDEIELEIQRRHALSLSVSTDEKFGEDLAKARVSAEEEVKVVEEPTTDSLELGAVEDLLNLIYFGSLFDVKTQNDFTSTMFTRTHERGCCLTYDCVTDDATDLLGERDLDMISKLGGFVTSRPLYSSISHKEAIQRCIEHAKHWIANSNQPIDSDSSVTYAELRERLTKIMATEYVTATPEMKAPEVPTAAGNYGSFQVPGHASVAVPVQIEAKDDNSENQHEDDNNHPSHEEELHKEEYVTTNSAEVINTEADEYQREVESKEQKYNYRRPYQNQRSGRTGGGGGGYRGYPNGRGGRNGGGRAGGSYQNGRNQFYDQPDNYQPRNYHNPRPRANRAGAGGGQSFNNQGSADYAASVDVGSG